MQYILIYYISIYILIYEFFKNKNQPSWQDGMSQWVKRPAANPYNSIPEPRWCREPTPYTNSFKS